MKTIELIGDIDGQHWLIRASPDRDPGRPGARDCAPALPGEDEAGRFWANGLASEWSAELADPWEDGYSLDDDHRVNAARSSVKGV